MPYRPSQHCVKHLIWSIKRGWCLLSYSDDKDKDEDKDKVHRRPKICYIFEKQRVQGYRCRDYKDKYKDIYKDKDIDKDKDKDKMHRRPNKCYIFFEKQGVQGYKLWPDQTKTDQGRPGQSRTDQDSPGQTRTVQDRPETDQDRPGQTRTDQDRPR